MNELSVIYNPLEVIIQTVTNPINGNVIKPAKFIGVKRSLIYDSFGNQLVSHKELVLIVALCSLNPEQEPMLYVTPKTIHYALTNRRYNESTDKRFLKKIIIPTLENLIAKNVVTVVDGLEVGDKVKVNTDIVLDVTNLLRLEKEPFVGIGKQELYRIMNVNRLHDKAISRERLLALFMSVVASISIHNPSSTFAQIYEDTKQYTGLVCYKSFEKLTELTGLSKTSMTEYFELLEEMKLLYCHSFGKYKLEDGKLRTLNNWYARYQFKEQVIDLAELWLSQQQHAIYNHKAILNDVIESD